MRTLPRSGDWNLLAFEKLNRVLGTEEAERVMNWALERSGMDSLNSPDDLGRFAAEVRGFGGYADAVGAMLSLIATLRGSTFIPKA